MKGLVNPPSKVIAFPCFIPDLNGSRQHGGIKYKKIYGIAERFEFLEKHLPSYVVYDNVFDEKLCEVPIKDVKNVYSPINRLRA